MSLLIDRRGVLTGTGPGEPPDSRRGELTWTQHDSGDREEDAVTVTPTDGSPKSGAAWKACGPSAHVFEIAHSHFANESQRHAAGRQRV